MFVQVTHVVLTESSRSRPVLPFDCHQVSGSQRVLVVRASCTSLVQLSSRILYLPVSLGLLGRPYSALAFKIHACLSRVRYKRVLG